MARSSFPGLKAWREGQGLTKTELAQMLKVPESSILRWERGGYVKKQSDCKALSDLMGGVAPVAVDKPLAPAVVPVLMTVKRSKRVTTEEAITINAADLARFLGLPDGTAIEVFGPGGDVDNPKDAIGTPLVLKATMIIQEGD